MDELLWASVAVGIFALLMILKNGRGAERLLLRHLQVSSPKNQGLREVLVALAYEAGAPWSLKRLRIRNLPKLFEFEEPGAVILVARSRFSSGSIILGQGFIRKATDLELQETLKHALLRLTDPRLPAATAGTAELLRWMRTISDFRRWVAWSVFGAGRRPFRGGLKSLSFSKWIAVILVSPIVDLFTRKSASAPWILKSQAHLTILTQQGRPSGWIPQLTQGLQPQFPMSLT